MGIELAGSIDLKNTDFGKTMEAFKNVNMSNFAFRLPDDIELPKACSHHAKDGAAASPLHSFARTRSISFHAQHIRTRCLLTPGSGVVSIWKLPYRCR